MMLEHLFGSRTRVKLLRLFLANPDQQWFVRELTRVIHEHINSVRRELQQLEKFGLVAGKLIERKKYYQVNAQFILYPELKALFVKSRVTVEKGFIEKLAGSGQAHYLALLGYFVDDAASAVDLFIVGSLSKVTLQKLLDDFKLQFGRELRYTLMTDVEYRYRHDVTDRFLFTILHSPKIVLIDHLTH